MLGANRNLYDSAAQVCRANRLATPEVLRIKTTESRRTDERINGRYHGRADLVDVPRRIQGDGNIARQCHVCDRGAGHVRRRCRPIYFARYCKTSAGPSSRRRNRRDSQLFRADLNGEWRDRWEGEAIIHRKRGNQIVNVSTQCRTGWRYKFESRGKTQTIVDREFRATNKEVGAAGRRAANRQAARCGR